MARRFVLACLLLTAPALSGCLAEDIWREPFVYREAASFGENQEGAEAFASALASLGSQAEYAGGNIVETVDSLPNNVVFENLREFLEGEAPGSGNAVHGAVTAVTGNASEAWVQLGGVLGEALDGVTAPFAGASGPVTFEVGERATRVQWTIDVLLTSPTPPEQGQNPTPVGIVHIRLVDPAGRERADYRIDTTRHVQDMVIEGTWGGQNEVRSHLGGTWNVEVDATGTGAWSLVVDAYEPEFDDWQWWQFWRADRREVTGE